MTLKMEKKGKQKRKIQFTDKRTGRFSMLKGMGLKTVAGFTRNTDKLKYVTRPADITLGKFPAAMLAATPWGEGTMAATTKSETADSL